MYIYTIKLCTTLVLAFVLFTTAFAFVPAAKAVTNEQVHEQKLLVMDRLVDTLREQVKLMQMFLIMKLESRVAQLEVQVDALSK